MTMAFLVLAVLWTWVLCRGDRIGQLLFGRLRDHRPPRGPRANPDIELQPTARRNTPRELLNAMPRYTWPGPRTSHEAITVKKEGEVSVVDLGTGGDEVTPVIQDQQMDVEAAPGIRTPEPSLINRAVDRCEPAAILRRCRYSQTTCAICLEDFVAGSSEVRELPCGHFFDPGCIDPYLLGASSQCPVCKKSVLPPSPAENTPRQEEGATRGPG